MRETKTEGLTLKSDGTWEIRIQVCTSKASSLPMHTQYLPLMSHVADAPSENERRKGMTVYSLLAT